MSPSHVAEPTYEAIRSRLLVGLWPMGYRLESGRLAEDLGVSISPVRDALNRLVGERLVDLVPGIGFHVPRLTERQVRDMLGLHKVLLLQAVERGHRPDSVVLPEVHDESHAARTDALFAGIAALSGNMELVETVKAIGTRLYRIRVHEVVLLRDAAAGLKWVMAAFMSDSRDLADALVAYHEVRIRNADHLLYPFQN